MDLLGRIADNDGLFLRREAMDAGLDDRALGRLGAAGVVHRIRHGVYLDAARWLSLDERGQHRLMVRAELKVNRAPAVVSHVSAVLEHVPAYWGLDLTKVHLTRHASRVVGRAAGVVQHRGKLRDGDTVAGVGVTLTSPARSLLELTTVTSPEAALVTANAILHAGLCDADDVWARYRAGIDRWPHTLSTNLVLRLMDHRIESVGESRTSYLMWRAGLPVPVPQFEVRDHRGAIVARLDFALPEHKVWIEFDGKEKYLQHLREGEKPGDAVFREKKREDLVRRLTGWRCIRITWADLEHPVRTAAMLWGELRVVA